MKVKCIEVIDDAFKAQSYRIEEGVHVGEIMTIYAGKKFYGLELVPEQNKMYIIDNRSQLVLIETNPGG